MKPTGQVSRRGFFRQATGASAASAAQAIGVVTGQSPQAPPRAWIIMAVNWEYNDEFSFQEGEFACEKVYFDKQEADAACRALCETFFNDSPESFGVWWDMYEVDPDTATWDDLRKAGFPEPYYVKELAT
jgi:hypothetical protein